MHNRGSSSFSPDLSVPGSPGCLLTLVTGPHFLKSAPARGEPSAGGGARIADRVTRQGSR